MKCSKCLTENSENTKICSQCGNELKIVCPECGKVNSPGSNFCNECGSRFYDGLQLPAQEPIAGSERKHVTVIFSDLAGYTAMTEKLDPESVKSVMKQVFEKISRIIAKYDGFIERYVGDSVMAVFGIPKAHEDDPVRAIKAAIEIHGSVASIGSWVEEKTGQGLAMHTGINTGLVVTGEVNRKKGTHGLIGFAINIASRLEALSKQGEILVGYDTFMQANKHFHFKELEAMKVKGKSAPLRVFRVDSIRREQISKFDYSDLKSDFIGRNEELSQFGGCIENLGRHYRGGIVFIIGEAGIGKSRLVAEYKKRLSNNSLSWLKSRSLSYGQSISYWPFLEILKDFAGITDEDDDVKGWSKLEDRINRMFPNELADTLPYLATLLALEVKGYLADRVRFLDGEAMKHQIFRASWRFLKRLASEQPLVLEFEDFHWSDQSTVELIQHLLPLVHKLPLLMCFIVRPTHDSPVDNLRNAIIRDHPDYYTEINLYPSLKRKPFNWCARILI